jgi:hypothetical protein
MKEIGMAEHVSEQLVRPEILGMDIPEREPVRNRRQYALEHKNYYVDDNQGADQGRESNHT